MINSFRQSLKKQFGGLVPNFSPIPYTPECGKSKTLNHPQNHHVYGMNHPRMVGLLLGRGWPRPCSKSWRPMVRRVGPLRFSIWSRGIHCQGVCVFYSIAAIATPNKIKPTWFSIFLGVVRYIFSRRRDDSNDSMIENLGRFSEISENLKIQELGWGSMQKLEEISGCLLAIGLRMSAMVGDSVRALEGRTSAWNIRDGFIHGCYGSKLWRPGFSQSKSLLRSGTWYSYDVIFTYIHIYSPPFRGQIMDSVFDLSSLRNA